MKLLYRDSVFGLASKRIESIKMGINDVMTMMNKMRKWPRAYAFMFKTLKHVHRAKAMIESRRLSQCAKELAVVRERLLRTGSAIRNSESEQSYQDKLLRKAFDSLQIVTSRLLTSKLFKYLEKNKLE